MRSINQVPTVLIQSDSTARTSANVQNQGTNHYRALNHRSRHSDYVQTSQKQKMQHNIQKESHQQVYSIANYVRRRSQRCSPVQPPMKDQKSKTFPSDVQSIKMLHNQYPISSVINSQCNYATQAKHQAFAAQNVITGPIKLQKGVSSGQPLCLILVDSKQVLYIKPRQNKQQKIAAVQCTIIKQQQQLYQYHRNNISNNTQVVALTCKVISQVHSSYKAIAISMSFRPSKNNHENSVQTDTGGYNCHTNLKLVPVY